MSYLIDTSVLLRLIHTASPLQKIAVNAVDKLKNENKAIFIFPQNLIEFWAVATRPIESNGLGLTVEQTELKLEQLKKLFILIRENEEIFNKWEILVGKYEVKGKTSHDARLVASMQTSGIENLLTFNVKDFKRYEDIIKVFSPQEVV